MGRSKRRRFLRKQKEIKNAENNNISQIEKTEIISDNLDATTEVLEPSKAKSWITSSTKYVYIIALAALISGIFTPYTFGFETEKVFLGMLIIFMAAASGVLIYTGSKEEKSSSKLILAGLGLMVLSLVLIYEIAERSLFG